jgi:hypothetical protein
MTVAFTLPLGKTKNVKNLVFSILTKEYPLKIIELTNYIRKRYGKSVTFQAVRKATLQLVEDGVLTRINNEFSINKQWVLDGKKKLDLLYEDLVNKKIKPNSLDSINGEVSVFTFNTINEMMKFWQDLVNNWFKEIKKGDSKVNCYQAAHAWEGLLHLDKERELMGQLKKKGIKSYIVSTGKSPLDKNIKKFYKNIGVKMQINNSSASFDRSFYIGTYGDLVIQSKYPEKIVDALDKFFKKNKTIEEMDLKVLSEIVNTKAKVKLTVIKNLEMAKQINKSILVQME